MALVTRLLAARLQTAADSAQPSARQPAAAEPIVHRHLHPIRSPESSAQSVPDLQLWTSLLSSNRLGPPLTAF